MNTVYGNFRLTMDLPEDTDGRGEAIRKAIEERLAAAENVLKATAGIEVSFEWEEIE